MLFAKGGKLSKWICRVFGHDLIYKGLHGINATFDGKPWPYKFNYSVYECKWCGYNNKKTGTVKIEDIWKEGKKHKRSLI